MSASFRWPKLTRRQWLRAAAGAGIVSLAGLGSYVRWIEPFWIDFVARELQIANLPLELDGKRLIQISDIHVGPIVDDDYVIRAFEMVSRLEPDYLVLTGDFISSRADGAAPFDQARRVDTHLKPAKLGTIAILGNHDYGPGWASARTANAICELLQDVGVTVLRNEDMLAAGLRFVGYDDLWAEQFGPKLMSHLWPSTIPTLVLCHNPEAVDLPAWSNYQGWILSGHTHGGQCKPPFLPPPLLPVKNRRYTSGAIDLHDGRFLYINRGLGYLRQVRFNVRPEVTVFTLRAAGTTIA
jgi:predicted MPP superfamily phosphohydrolase